MRFSPACPPPPRFASLLPCSPSRLLTPDGFSRPLVSSRHARARARDCESPAPRPPSRSRAPSFLFLLSAAASSPSLSAAPFARLDLTLLLPSRALSSCSCSLFLLVRPHRAFSSTVRVRGHGAPLRIISSRLPRLALAPLSPPFSAPSSSSSLFLSACSPSAASSSFAPYSILSLPLGLADPPSTPFALSLPARAHAAWYKLFQKFVLLLLSLNHSQRFEARDAHSSPVQCATLFAPCRLRQADDSEGDDGDNGSWMSGASLVVPAERPGSILRG